MHQKIKSLIQVFSGKIQPESPWFIIISFTLVSVFLALVGLGTITNFIFPLGAFAVGLYLYFRFPLLYVGFTWWLWFLSPLFRRLVDYYGGGFNNPSPILLAPLFTTCITTVTLWRYLFKTNNFKANNQKYLPYFLVFTGIIYAFSVGLIYKPTTTVILAFIEWIAPFAFSFHLYVNWRKYLQYRDLIQQVFIWAGLILGVYGVIQYLFAPPWDSFWLLQAEIPSAGKPEPLGIRVFSTFYSPRPFGTAMASLLLVMTNRNTRVTLFGNIFAYLSFLLCINRVAWGSWLVGIFCLWNSLKEKHQIKLIATILILVLAVLFIASLDPFSEKIMTRFETFSDLENDGSAIARADTYSRLIGTALTSFFGEGLGKTRTGLDSGILYMLFYFGWFGITFYIGGLLLLMLRIWNNPSNNYDVFLITARAISTGIIAQTPFGGVTDAEQGMFLWAFLGIALSGITYYKNQRQMAAQKPL